MTTTNHTHPHVHRVVVRLLVAMVAAIVALGSPAAARAASDSDEQPLITWGIRPSSATGPDGRDAFEYALDPGDTIEDYVGVSNFTDQPLQLAVYASDAFNTPGGDFDLLAAAEAPIDVGAWIEFAEPVVTVPPRSRLDIPFRLTIPANATPGDHAGGIVASLAVPGTGADDSRVAIDRRVGARIYLRVSGDIAPAASVSDVHVDHDGSLNPVGRGRATVTYTITNTGNVRLAGRPTVEISGPLGLGRRRAAGEAITQLLPGNHLTFRTTVDGVAPLGRLRAEVRLEASTVGIEPGTAVPVATAGTSTWCLPWSQVAVLALLLTTVILRRRRRRCRRQELAAQLAAARTAGRNEALAGAPSGDVTDAGD